MAIKVNGTLVGGGGVSLSDATPQPTGTAAAGVSTSAARADHVHAASVAAADISDAGAAGVDLVQAATAAEGRAALAAETRYDTIAAGPWTLVSVTSSGQAAISGGDIVLTQPATPATLSNPGRAGAYVALATIADPVAFDARVRLVSLTGAASNTEVTLAMSSSVRDNELRVFTNGSGGVIICGYLGASWSGGLATSSSGAISLSAGTGWLRMRVEGKRVQLFYGTGTGTSSPTVWTVLYEGTISPQVACDWDRIGVYLTCHSNPGATVTATLDSLRVVNLGAAP